MASMAARGPEGPCHLPCGVIHSLMDRIYYSYIMKILVQLTVLNSLSESKSSGTVARHRT